MTTTRRVGVAFLCGVVGLLVTSSCWSEVAAGEPKLKGKSKLASLESAPIRQANGELQWSEQDLIDLKTCVLDAAHNCPVDGVGDKRNDKFWVMTDRFVIRDRAAVPDPLAAIRDVFESPPETYEIYCTKLGLLAIHEGFIQFFEKRKAAGKPEGEAGLAWMRAMIEKNDRDPSNEGPGGRKYMLHFVDVLKPTAASGFSESELQYGDQPHFRNPFHGRPENGNWRGVGSGTEGNNMFFDSRSKRPIVSPYHRAGCTVLQEKESMTDWAKHRDNYLHSDFYKADKKNHLPDPKWVTIDQIRRVKLPKSFAIE